MSTWTRLDPVFRDMVAPALGLTTRTVSARGYSEDERRALLADACARAGEALHWGAEAQALLAEAQRALAAGGLLDFGIVAAAIAAGWPEEIVLPPWQARADVGDADW